MKAVVLDTVTGETKVMEGIRSFDWAEGNYSCDCNRGADLDAVCKSERFLVIEAEFNDPDDYEYSLFELNENYPVELLKLNGML